MINGARNGLFIQMFLVPHESLAVVPCTAKRCGSIIHALVFHL